MSEIKKSPDFFCCADGLTRFVYKSHSGFQKLDLSCSERTTLEKLGFAIDALNRWTAFVQSVERVEELITLYEERAGVQLGGSGDE